MPPWLEIVIRSTAFLIVLFLLTKLLGKKQLSEISFFEYVYGITIGSIAAEVAMGLDSHIMHGIMGILVFGGAPFLADWISLKSKKARDIFEGRSTVVIKNGKIMEDNLKKEKYSTDELLELLRKKNVFQVADVEFAVLETTGDISVLLKKENQPLTPKDLHMIIPKIKEPQTVIMDGKILDEPLSTRGLSRGWLKLELDKIGVATENVFLGQVDSYGQLTVDLYDDKLQVPSPQQMPLLLATMKKCQADLEIFALETKNQQAKGMYVKNSEKLQKIIDKLTPMLKG